MSVPAILAGTAVRSTGLVPATDAYVVVLLLLIGITLVVERLSLTRRAPR